MLGCEGWDEKQWRAPVLAIRLASPVAIRRRNPVRALGLLLLACVVLLFADGQLIRGAFVPLVAVLYLVAATYRRAAGIAALAARHPGLAVPGLGSPRAGQGPGNLAG